jgi:hypothetical protein
MAERLRPTHKANVIAVYEPVTYKIRDTLRLTTLQAFKVY